MTNNLQKIKQELRAFSKRCKDVHYSESMLIRFLITGLVFMTNNLFSASEDKAIGSQRQSISASIGDMRQNLRKARSENNKLLKDTNLELTKLMEQGDHVVKSPWSSWQFGINYFYNDWHGTYKGRGDKKDKYPYEGIFARSEDPFERYTSPASNSYSRLALSTNPRSASSNARSGLSSYGIASNTPASEPITSFEVAASITPRNVVKGALNLAPKTATQPNLPQAINFNPVTPVLVAPSVDDVVIPIITPPGTGNGDDMYIRNGSNSTALVGTLANSNVGMISQYSTSGGGTMDVTVNNGSTMDISTRGVTFTGHQGSSHNGNSTYSSDLSTTGYSGYAAMKLVGGHEIKIDDTTINFGGTGNSSYARWLFHTDGHNDHGNSTWNIGSGSTINVNGTNLVMYTSQYHGSGNTTVGFTNGGTITTAGSGNYLWITLSAGAWPATRVMAFENRSSGTINLGGTNDTLVLLGAEYANTGGFTFINDGTLQLNGTNNKGIVVKSGQNYLSSEILLNTAMKVTGDNSVGIGFLGYADLEGGKTYNNGSTANNVVITLPTTSRESVLNVDLQNNQKSTALFFNNDGSNPFNVNDFNLTSTNGTNNTLVYVKDGTVNLKGTTNGTMSITNGTGDVAIYTTRSGSATADPLTNAGKITISNSKSSIGIYALNSGNVTNTGVMSISGESVKAIVADNTTVTSSGQVDVTGTALSATDGAVGLAAMNNGTLNHTGGGTITVDGSASIGAFGQSGGTVNITNGTVATTGGAFNTYAQAGTVNYNGTTINTGQQSLAFFADSTGKITFSGPTTANISGGTDANTRGTAFYYQGTNHSPFTAGDITTWAANTFNGTLNQLTLNMDPGSRLFIASDVRMNLSDTAGSGLAGAVPATIVGSDYKTFMLYNSLLTLNQSINLDDANDAYNLLELSNSSVDNNNNNTITGTQTGQTAIAQENLLTNRNAVTINNNGAINLSGANSTGIYTKFGVVNNNATGTITVGDTSTGIYGIADSQLTNAGTITVGNSSTGIYSEGSTTQGVTNSGTIESTGSSSIAMLYKPEGTVTGGFLTNSGTINMTGDQNVALYGTENTPTASYGISNTGTITMGDSATLSNPNVALYSDGPTKTVENSGTITMGANTIGLYGHQAAVSGGALTVGDGGVGVYSQSGNVNLTGGSISVGGNEAVGVYTTGSGQTISNTGTALNIGDSSFGFVNVGSGNTITSSMAANALGTNSIYIYSNDSAGTVNNSTNLTATGGQNYGIYAAGIVNNSGNMDFGSGIGNVGIYSVGGGTATNTGTITVGGSNTGANQYGIGMAAGYTTTDTGNIVNNGTINVNGESSIGMYASGAGSTVSNTGNINLNANSTTGIFLDNGATGTNSGIIRTGVSGLSNVVGVYVSNGATLTNTGTITIDATNGIGAYLKGGTVINPGTITVTGTGAQQEYEFQVADTSKGFGGVNIDTTSGSAVITRNGLAVTPVSIVTNMTQAPKTVSASSIGMYVDTSGISYTNPIGNVGALTDEADLIIGTEAAEYTTSKDIIITDPNIINPYRTSMLANPTVTNWNIYSGGLTWTATGTLDQNGYLTGLAMSKIPYTNWAGTEGTPVNSTDTYNFLDGLEQRYGVEGLGTREKRLFDKLNSIGKNEEILFYQATDEMMGHQYGALQQRINATGNILDKEFRYLKHDWRNPSKQNNKIKVFGMRDQYSTDTAGIIDYTSNAYGVAYVNENETVKMGNSAGWYAGVVTNRFKFKDIGHSRENQTQIKAGIFKTMSPANDHNGALQWTVGGDVFFGINDMKRKYLVVDEIFQAKSDYNSYGAAFKTDLGYDIRMSERTHLRPYGALKMEYGRFNKIKEDSGEMRLEIKDNDYFSVKPEVGVEFRYVQPLAVRTNLTVGLSAAYENELGKMGSKNNEGRVRYTSADWFGIRGEKEDRRGSGKFDLNIGVDNTRFGVTVNAGYDTKGENVRGGIGFRAIY